MTNKQSGLTLIELLIATAISVTIGSLMGTSLYQIFVVTDKGSDTLTAMHQIQNAAHWIALDGQMAKAANGGTELGLTLPDNSTISYALSGTDLQRTQGASLLTVARNITDANFTVDGRILTVSITSGNGEGWETTEQGSYKVYLRPSEAGG